VVKPGKWGFSVGFTCRRQHVGTTEDVYNSINQSAAESSGADDVSHDAFDVYFPIFNLPKRTGFILGSIQYNYHCYAIFCYRWLGWSYFNIKNKSPKANKPDKRDKKLKERIAEIEQANDKINTKALQADIVGIDTANEEGGDESVEKARGQ